MIARLVAYVAGRPWAVLGLTLAIAAACAFGQRSLRRDVIPDLSDPQVVLVADWMGHSAQEVAERVTDPLTAAFKDVPGSTAIRGSSMSGMGYVDVVFSSLAGLRLGRAELERRWRALRLPDGVRVQLGPEASSTGWVFQYALMPPERTHSMPMAERAHSGDPTLRKLRDFQDRVLAPKLAAVPGVAEVSVVGGDVDELHVETSADQLSGSGAALSDVVDTVRRALKTGKALTLDELGATPLAHGDPTGARAVLKDVAQLKLAAGMPNGVADADGDQSIVAGTVIAKRDADVGAVIAAVKRVVDDVRGELPPGSQLGVLYDRSELSGRVQNTLLRAVGEEIAVVALVIFSFLLHARSALVPLVTLPLVVLITFAAMRVFGIPATVMSLGGIAIALGLAVDADLVALEACHRRLEAEGGHPSPPARRSALIAAASSFAPAILTSLAIAGLAFVPVFAFGGESGRLLRPLALTKTLVVGAALLVTLFVAPALRDRLLGGRVVPELGNPLTRWLVRAYRPFVEFALARPAFTLATAALIAISCLPILPRLGSEFLPRVDEGDLFYMPTTAPGIAPEDAVAELRRQDAVISEHPEVATVFGKIGRGETATDPAPYSMAETTIRLKPKGEWPTVARPRWYSSWAPAPLASVLRRVWPDRAPKSQGELVAALDSDTAFPGWTNAWTAPIRARLDMMATGVRTPVGARILAADPARLDALGALVRAAVQRVPGTKSAVYESLGGELRPSFVFDEAALARHHVDAALARATAELLISGGQVGEFASPDAAGKPLRVRVSLAAPWAPKSFDELLRDASVRSKDDVQPVPLALLGHPRFERVPALLHTEHGERVGYVYADLTDDTSVGGYVSAARAEVERALAGENALRPGERVEWTGQYELIAAGQRRLAWIAPLVVLAMFGLLFWQFRSLKQAAIVLVSVPLALVGSFWTLYWLDYRLSAPVWVGLLSVVGLAMQTSVVMVVYIDDAFHRRIRAGQMRTRDDVIAAHAEGTVRRLRPKLMTIGTMAAALLPLLWADGAGSEIMKRVAAPMVGGLLTSAFLTLEVIPVLYTIWRTQQLERAQRAGAPLEEIVGAAPDWARQ